MDQSILNLPSSPKTISSAYRRLLCHGSGANAEMCRCMLPNAPQRQTMATKCNNRNEGSNFLVRSRRRSRFYFSSLLFTGIKCLFAFALANELQVAATWVSEVMAGEAFANQRNCTHFIFKQTSFIRFCLNCCHRHTVVGHRQRTQFTLMALRQNIFSFTHFAGALVFFGVFTSLALPVSASVLQFFIKRKLQTRSWCSAHRRNDPQTNRTHYGLRYAKIQKSWGNNAKSFNCLLLFVQQKLNCIFIGKKRPTGKNVESFVGRNFLTQTFLIVHWTETAIRRGREIMSQIAYVMQHNHHQTVFTANVNGLPRSTFGHVIEMKMKRGNVARATKCNWDCRIGSINKSVQFACHFAVSELVERWLDAGRQTRNETIWDMKHDILMSLLVHYYTIISLCAVRPFIGERHLLLVLPTITFDSTTTFWQTSGFVNV